MDDSFSILKTRLIEIMRQRDRLTQELEALALEERELKMAEAVLQRLGSKHIRDSIQVRSTFIDDGSEKTIHLVESKGIPGKGTPRPNGIPTVPDMVVTLLEEAETRGKVGLTGRQIMDGVGARWWPGVGWSSILPTVLRAIRDGRGPFEKNGNLIQLKKDEGPKRRPGYFGPKNTGVA